MGLWARVGDSPTSQGVRNPPDQIRTSTQSWLGGSDVLMHEGDQVTHSIGGQKDVPTSADEIPGDGPTIVGLIGGGEPATDAPAAGDQVTSGDQIMISDHAASDQATMGVGISPPPPTALLTGDGSIPAAADRTSEAPIYRSMSGADSHIGEDREAAEQDELDLSVRSINVQYLNPANTRSPVEGWGGWGPSRRASSDPFAHQIGVVSGEHARSHD